MKKCPISNELSEAITKILIFDEGLEERPYKDTRDFWTIGVGHFIGPDLRNLQLSRNVCIAILNEDIKKHWEEACEIFGADWLMKQTTARQAAILSLVFNLGAAKLSTFTQTVPAIKEERWQSAGALLRKTKWARDVDPRQRPDTGRDDRIASMIETGAVHDEYGLGKKNS